MGLRKYERAVIRHRCIKKHGNADMFPEEWSQYKSKRTEKKNEDGKTTVTRNRPVHKKKHYDNGRNLLARARLMKEMLAGKRTGKTNTEKSAVHDN